MGQLYSVVFGHQPCHSFPKAQFRVAGSDTVQPNLSHRIAQFDRGVQPRRLADAIQDGLILETNSLVPCQSVVKSC